MTTIDTSEISETTTCPAWCTQNHDLERSLGAPSEVVGLNHLVRPAPDVTVERIDFPGSEPATAGLSLAGHAIHDYDDMTAARARELASALIAAADKLDEIETGR